MAKITSALVDVACKYALGHCGEWDNKQMGFAQPGYIYSDPSTVRAFVNIILTAPLMEKGPCRRNERLRDKAPFCDLERHTFGELLKVKLSRNGRPANVEGLLVRMLVRPTMKAVAGNLTYAQYFGDDETAKVPKAWLAIVHGTPASKWRRTGSGSCSRRRSTPWARRSGPSCGPTDARRSAVS